MEYYTLFSLVGLVFLSSYRSAPPSRTRCSFPILSTQLSRSISLLPRHLFIPPSSFCKSSKVHFQQKQARWMNGLRRLHMGMGVSSEALF